MRSQESHRGPDHIFCRLGPTALCSVADSDFAGGTLQGRVDPAVRSPVQVATCCRHRSKVGICCGSAVGLESEQSMRPVRQRRAKAEACSGLQRLECCRDEIMLALGLQLGRTRPCLHRPERLWLRPGLCGYDSCLGQALHFAGWRRQACQPHFKRRLRTVPFCSVWDMEALSSPSTHHVPTSTLTDR